MSRDDLKIFDELDDENQPQEEFARINDTHEEERATTRRAGVRRIIIGLIFLAVLLLAILRFVQWGENRQEQESAAPAIQSTSAPAETSSSPTSTYVDGDNQQAAETRGAPQPSQVAIPAATQPEVDKTNPESVMKGFVTIINSRDSADDFDRVKQWVEPYSLIEDMSSFDVYQADAAQVLPAPVTTRDVQIKDAAAGQPANTPSRVSKVVENTVEAHTGQKVKLTWELTAMQDGDEWKVTDARLDSWQGA